jgi:hypothetical protein
MDANQLGHPLIHANKSSKLIWLPTNLAIPSWMSINLVIPSRMPVSLANLFGCQQI